MTRERALEIILREGGAPRDAAERREFLAFLETAPEYRKLGEEQQALWQVLDAWKPVDPSADFDQRLMARIEASSAAEPWQSRFLAAFRPRFAGAFALLLIAALTVVLQQPAPNRGGSTASLENPDDLRYYEQLDRALDDMEMLADFEALPLALEGEDQS